MTKKKTIQVKQTKHAFSCSHRTITIINKTAELQRTDDNNNADRMRNKNG